MSLAVILREGIKPFPVDREIISKRLLHRPPLASLLRTMRVLLPRRFSSMISTRRRQESGLHGVSIRYGAQLMVVARAAPRPSRKVDTDLRLE